MTTKDKILKHRGFVHVFGWCVVGGVFLEVVLAAFDANSWKMKIWAVLANALVVIGVYGEIHFSGKASKLEDELQRESEERIAEANRIAAIANERVEELRNINLSLERQLLDLEKNVRGREITEMQHDQIMSALEGLKVPDLVTYVAADPEARQYGFALIRLLQEIGMSGKVEFLKNTPPMQMGVMYCGTGTPEDSTLLKILMAAGIVTVGTAASKGALGQDNNGDDIVLPYCPPGSIFVGVRQPLQQWWKWRASSDEG